jgi:DNA polymerase III epsilon subunit-like protein
MTLVFDIETTGLPLTSGFFNYPDPNDLSKYNNARIIEIACVLIDYDHTTNEYVTKQMYSSLVRPNNFKITNDHIHGITNRTVSKYGHSIEDVLHNIECLLKKASVIVAHNLQFDYHVLMSEAYRNKRDTLAHDLSCKKKFCTMITSKNVIGLKRFPKLVNLYHDLYPNEPEWTQQHRALDDVKTCVDCYTMLKQIIRKKTLRIA